jgi:hypothetical protein
MDNFLRVNWFKIVVAFAILLGSVSLSYYILHLSNTQKSTQNNIPQVSTNTENNTRSTADTENLIEKVIPSGALLREYQKIPDTKQESYVGLYILNSKISDLEENTGNLYYSSCPEQTMGQTASGEYHLFLFQNNEIINDIIVPNYDSSLDNNIISLSYNNTESNNNIFFEGLKPSDSDQYSIAKTQLIHFHDYNGDGLQHEFSLVGDSLACGHVDYLVAGYDETSNKTVIYGIKTKDKTVYWYDNFIPERSGIVKVVWTCGDHGSDTETIQIFEINKETSNYDLFIDDENKCANQ